jgi:hypothetical protein
MAHEPTRDALIALANDTATNPAGFLEGLSDIHDEWHQPFGRTYGFLLFHFRVVRYFIDIVGPVLNPAIAPYAKADFQAMNHDEFDGDTAGVETLQGLADFSSAIESWHNITHARIAAATGTPMMDPRQNIYFRPFWRLHTYIDNLFQVVIQQYGENVHAGQFLTVPAIAAHIETAHHNWVPAI